MRKELGMAAAALLLFSVGCDKKSQDAGLAQGQAAVAKAGDLAGTAWKSAKDQAARLTSDSGKSAIEAAEAQLVALRDKLSSIKTPSVLDSLRLDSIKEEIQRLQAALELQNLKKEMDIRVKNAMTMKGNAEKSYHDVRNKLTQVDAEYQDLQKKLHSAESAYDNAAEKVKETTQKIQAL